MREFVQEPMNTVSTVMSRIGVPAVSPMYWSARVADSRTLGSPKDAGSGTESSMVTLWAGLVPHVTYGLQRRGVDGDLLVEGRVVVGGERAPVVDRGVPVGALGREGAAFEIRERRVVGGDQPGARPGLDRHVADRHAALHRERTDRLAAVFDDRSDPAAGADPLDDREHDVLGGHAGGQVALDRDRHGAGRALGERLGREDVLDLARPDPERKGTERAVGRGVAVAADDGHPRLGEALFGSDHVDDSLPGIAHPEQANAELGAVLGEDLDLAPRDRIRDPQFEPRGRDVVVHRRDGELGTAHAGARSAAARRRPAGT